MNTTKIFVLSLLAYFAITDAHAQFEGNPLSQAVDNTAYNFLADSPGFIAQNSVFHTGGDAAASQTIQDDEVAIMFTQFTDTHGQGGSVSFDWKVSSEYDFDFLIFLLLDESENTIEQRSISGEDGWSRITINIPTGDHTLAWGYSKDSSISIGADKGYIDNVQIVVNGTPPPPLPPECTSGRTEINSALDNEELTFSAFNENQPSEFECQTETFTTGGSAAKSKQVQTQYSTSAMYTYIEGPVNLIFDWRIDAGPEDTLYFSMGANHLDSLKGNTAWAIKEFRVPSGLHRIRWTYSRWSASPVGENAGFVDNVRLEPATSIITPILMILLFGDE